MKKVFIVLILGVLLLSVVGCSNNQKPDDETLTATGTATINVFPDEAKVYVTVETLSESAEESKNENSRISERVINELIVIGLARSDIQTQNFNVYPEYEYPGRSLKGYRTQNRLVVITNDFLKIGKIVDAAVLGGATRIESIQFELSEEKQAEAKKQALKEASKDAKEKAAAIAEGLGVSLGKIKSVQSQDYYYQPYRFFEGAGMAVDEAQEEVAKTSVIPTELDTRATVNVVFKIG